MEVEQQAAGVRDERVQRVKERARALYRSGFYTAEDGKTLMTWLENGVALVALEGILWDAEQMDRERREVVPVVPQRRAE